MEGPITVRPLIPTLAAAAATTAATAAVKEGDREGWFQLVVIGLLQRLGHLSFNLLMERPEMGSCLAHYQEEEEEV